MAHRSAEGPVAILGHSLRLAAPESGRWFSYFFSCLFGRWPLDAGGGLRRPHAPRRPRACMAVSSRLDVPRAEDSGLGVSCRRLTRPSAAPVIKGSCFLARALRPWDFHIRWNNKSPGRMRKGFIASEIIRSAKPSIYELTRGPYERINEVQAKSFAVRVSLRQPFSPTSAPSFLNQRCRNPRQDRYRVPATPVALSLAISAE